MIEISDVDVPQNMLDSEVHKHLYQNELVAIVQGNIEKQYIDFENLGQNYYSMFRNELEEVDKLNILGDMVSYVNDHLISIVNIDDFDSDKDRLLTSGEYIYEFICIDCYASLIPAFMEYLGITSVDELDGLINVKYLETPAKFKNDFLSVIQMTIEQLLKLQTITPEINKDPNYSRLLGKYYYYQEIIEYGNTQMFLESYLRPVISKYSSDLIWKLL